MSELPLAERVDALDWDELREQLETRGFAQSAPLLIGQECAALCELFDSGAFRATIDMARYRFGEGSYRYFAHPLPAQVAALRTSLYRHLAPIANAWSERLGGAGDAYPPEHAAFLERCHASGQERPTPLLLRYGPGGFNALHQDLYGDVHFPLQATALLSQPGVDFAGGEFVLLEQRPRAQSRAHVLAPPRGALVVFPTRYRPQAGKRGFHRSRCATA